MPPKQKSNLTKIREMLQKLRNETEPYIGIHAVIALMYVAESMPDGMNQRDLAEKVGVSNAAIDRIMDQLGEWKDEGVPGLRLIEEFTPKEDRRKSILILSKKGEKFLREISEMV